MDNAIKQRLVGALVIVALGVIFVPMILEGPHDLGEPGSDIPPPPAFSGSTVTEPVVLPPPAPSMPEQAVVPELGPAEPEAPTAPAVAEAAQAEPESSPARPEVKSAPEPEPVAEKPKPVDPALQGFVVQVASLSNESNAFALRDRLRGQGFSCFVERVQTDKGVLFRVRIGPEIKRENADKLREKLEKTTEFKGLVQSYP